MILTLLFEKKIKTCNNTWLNNFFNKYNNENVYKIQKLASKKVNFNSPLYA